jgi:hypothetical protein
MAQREFGMKQFMGFVILTGASLVVGCAAQAPASSTATGGGHQTVAAAGSAVPHAASAAAQVTPAKPQTTSGMSQSASAAPQKGDNTSGGYTRVVVHGKELFCRTEAITGTRMEHRICLTQAQLEARQEAARQYLETLQRDAGVAGAVNPLGPMMGGPTGGR